MAVTRGRWIVLVLLGGGIIAAATLGYRHWPQLIQKIRKQPPAVTSDSDQTSAVPPFSTKEPERYQAIRLITDKDPAGESSGQSPSTEKTIIARDGINRREEVSRDSGPVTVYLENSTGRFLLLPDSKMYIDLNAQPDAAVGIDGKDGDADFSPDRLLHETSGLTRYQNLGPEISGGRKATKYLATSADTDPKSGSGDQTFIWVDDEIGMPIKSETRSEDGAISTMELQNIRLEPADAHLFELPLDYKKVDFAQLQAEIARLSSNSNTNQNKP